MHYVSAKYVYPSLSSVKCEYAKSTQTCLVSVTLLDYPFDDVTYDCVPGAKVVAGVVATPIAVGLAVTVAGLAVAVATVVAPTYGTYKLAGLIRKRLNEDKYD